MRYKKKEVYGSDKNNIAQMMVFFNSYGGNVHYRNQNIIAYCS